nr:EOG090X047D [Sida crystallina]
MAKAVEPKNGKKSQMFETYWDEADIISGLENGTLIEGAIRINPKNYKEAYIAAPEEGAPDIFIDGMLHRNRALNGDIVVCYLIPPEEAQAESIKKTPMRNCSTPQKCNDFKDGGSAKLKETPRSQNSASKRRLPDLSRNDLNDQPQLSESLKLNETHEQVAISDKTCVELPIEVLVPGETQNITLKENAICNESGLDAVVTGVSTKNAKKKLPLNEKKVCKPKQNKEIKEIVGDFKENVKITSNLHDQLLEEADHIHSELPDSKQMEGSTEAKKRRNRRSLRRKRNLNNICQELDSKCTITDVTTADPQDLTIADTPDNGLVCNNVAKKFPKRAIQKRSLKSDSNASITEEPPVFVQYSNENSEAPPRQKAKVVFIKEYKHTRRAIGQLRQWPYGQSGPEPKWILFAPKDYRIPRLKIPFSREIAAYVSQPNMLYLAQIVSWDDVIHPLGSLSYCVGESGDLESETIALLLEHSVDYSPFSAEVLADLPQLPWTIPAEELKKRRDFRKHCIFTIDPSDARDLDDAVYGRFLKMADDGVTKLYQISVHIADVSFFVKEETVLDVIASDRATSNYLVDRVIPMLPSVLCEHVCSLNPGEDRLAFSVEWIINEEGEIQEEWFGRSVIRSCVKLSYDHAQAVIEGRTDIDWPVIHGQSLEDVVKSIEVLQSVAGHLRAKRVRQGALRIDLPRLAFSMDWKTRTTTGFRLYEIKESNRLIEEFMLLANMRVAEKIYQAFPKLAVLRCHPPPNETKLSQVAQDLQAVGIHVDTSSSAALQESLIRYGQTVNDPVSLARNLVISNLLAKPMKCAAYICAGNAKSEKNFHHFALSVPFYTHFTSPIRRYPDILVHRLLSAALTQHPMGHWNQNLVKKQLENCNSRKLSAKALQDLHSELHLSALIRRNGSIEVKAIVFSVLDHAVDVVFLYLGIVRRLYLDKLPLDRLSFSQSNGTGTLSLVWSAVDGESRPLNQCITMFSLLEVLLVPHEKGELQFSLVLQRPTPVVPVDSSQDQPEGFTATN